jgi:hypothetical protein
MAGRITEDVLHDLRSRNSSVGIATGCTTVALFPTGEMDCSLLHTVQISPGTNQSVIQLVPDALSQDLKGLGRKADNSPQSSDEIKNDGAIPPLPHTSS